MSSRAAALPARRCLDPTCVDVARLAALPQAVDRPGSACAVVGMPHPTGMLRGTSYTLVRPAGGRWQARMRPRDRVVITLA